MNADQWAHKLCLGIRYKRDYLFTFTSLGDALQMHFDAYTQNARSPDWWVQGYTAVLPFDPRPDTGQVLEWVRQSIRRFELHEVDEFLHYFDYRINDPHAAGVDPDPTETTP